MSENFKEKIDDLEMIAANFKTATNSKITYMKEKITDLIKSGPKLPFEFEYLLVAFSRNGGLIAMCKQMNYYDRSKSRINDDILVMHQDAGKRYYIPLPLSNEEKRVQVSIINLEFNDDEQLYAFGSDGSLYKIDILTAKAVKKLNSPRLEDEGVTKVKLFEKGYIALTKKGNIYYVPDIKKQNPIFMINIKNQLKFSDNIDFIGIPPSKSKSGKFELLINNENGNGLLHIEKQDVDDSNNRIIERTVPVSLLVSGKLEKYDPEKNSTPSGGSESISSEKPKKGFLGKVSAICMSPSKSEIAVYCAQNTTAYIFPSNLDDLSSFEEMTFKKENLEEELEEDEVQEHLALFSYNKKYQFLFCGEQSLAICGQRFVVIITRKEEILSFKITDESAVASMTGSTLFTSISEIDGLRYLCEDGVFLISEVCKELYDVCYTFAKNPAKKLINAYGAFISKNADCDKQIRDNFANSQMAPVRAATGKGLKTILKDKGNLVVTTLINKFETVCKNHYLEVDSDKFYVLIDEAHRSQYSSMYNYMREVLPNATFIAFTGTPLVSKAKRNTYKKFGDPIHSYTMKRSMEDKITVPLVYEGRKVKLSAPSDTINAYFDSLTEHLPDETKADLKTKVGLLVFTETAENLIKRDDC